MALNFETYSNKMGTIVFVASGQTHDVFVASEVGGLESIFSQKVRKVVQTAIIPKTFLQYREKSSWGSNTPSRTRVKFDLSVLPTKVDVADYTRHCPLIKARKIQKFGRAWVNVMRSKR